MRRIFLGVRTVWYPDVVHVERELLALAKVEQALMRAAPVIPQVGFVFVVPDEPPAAFEEPRGWHFQVGQDLRETTNVHGSRWFQDPRGVLDPLKRPFDVSLLGIERVPLRLLDIVWWVGEDQIHGAGTYRR